MGSKLFSGLSWTPEPKHLHHCSTNTITLPDSFPKVTTVESSEEVAPESVGLTQEGVEAIWKAVEGVYRTATHPGISLCMRRRGEVILHRSIGHAQGNGPHAKADEAKELMRPDTPVCLFSASKAVTAFLIHLLNEDKLIDLHDPISFYEPEFGQNGKKNTTIHQVLSHRSGIPGLPEGLPVDTLWDNDTIWKLLCESAPNSPRGDKLAYHALTGGYILERVLNKVTGQGIQEFLDERLRKPMNMKYFKYGLDAEYTHCVAENHVTGMRPFFPVSRIIRRALGGSLDMVQEVSNDPRFMQAVIPAGNIYGSAEEICNFFQMLLNGGEWNGARVCDPMTVKRLTHEYAAVQFDRTLMLPMRYSAGLMLGGDPIGMWGKHSAAAFGHIGLINKLCWADPERDISVGLLTTGIPIVAHNIPALARFLNRIDQFVPKDKKLSA
ncbi:MAG: serine hydrolase domain-containing protein [Oleiphilaceae bacterium]|nr:serine hydrolase domain-containing protein [Oleiphilaceae bacterium]